mgnify:CR=1 FL=1
MSSFIITAISSYSPAFTHRKAEVKNVATQTEYFISFKEHDANTKQISAIFTDKNYQEIKSCAVLESRNGHTFETIVVGDILTGIL